MFKENENKDEAIKLPQKIGFLKEAVITLGNEKIGIDFKGLFSKSYSEIPIFALNPVPLVSRSSRRPYVLVVLAVAVAAAIGAVLAPRRYVPVEALYTIIPLAILLVIYLLPSTYEYFKYGNINIVIFPSDDPRFPPLILRADRPSEDTVQKFITELKARIKKQ